MSWKDQLLGQVGASAGSAASYYIGKATGASQGMANDQVEQQKKLTAIQEGANARAARNSLNLQKEMIDYTNPSMTMKRLEDAGLNPALMYGQGGAGGTTTGSVQQSGASGATASDEASRKMNSIQEQGIALQIAKLESEINKNNADARAALENAGLGKEKATTEAEQRDVLIENLRQQGIERWMNNELKRFQQHGGSEGVVRNKSLNWYTAVNEESKDFQAFNTSVLKTIAETNNIDINTKYVNEKVSGYLQELVNGTKQADAAMINAASGKLQAEFVTGKDVDWKNVGELLVRFIGALK